MPKTVKSRNILGVTATSKNTGHSVTVTTTVEMIPSLAENEIQNIYYNFVNPYLVVGPYKLPNFREFERIVKIIDNQLENIGIQSDYKLKLFKGILDILIRGRSTYFYDIQLEKEIDTLRKINKQLEALVYQYSSELSNCNGPETGFTLTGSVGIKVKKPKNLMYAQAILNINMAWYIYLYNSQKIEYDKYQGVIEFIKEKGQQTAYNELIELLDEKYKDIEDDICHQLQESSSSASDSQDKNSNCDCDDKSSDTDTINPDNPDNPSPQFFALFLSGSLSVGCKHIPNISN